MSRPENECYVSTPKEGLKVAIVEDGEITAPHLDPKISDICGKFRQSQLVSLAEENGSPMPVGMAIIGAAPGDDG